MYTCYILYMYIYTLYTYTPNTYTLSIFPAQEFKLQPCKTICRTESVKIHLILFQMSSTFTQRTFIFPETSQIFLMKPFVTTLCFTGQNGGEHWTVCSSLAASETLRFACWATCPCCFSGLTVFCEQPFLLVILSLI